jgi:hypothetical protein
MCERINNSEITKNKIKLFHSSNKHNIYCIIITSGIIDKRKKLIKFTVH